MASEELTRASVMLALENTIEEVNGQWRCRICPRLFVSRKAVPVHELVHRRAVGLAPPPHSGTAKGPPFIVCKYDGCEDRMVRTSLAPHLMGRKHGLDRAAASFYARQRADEERYPHKRALDIVEARLDDEAAADSPMTDLAAVEAVTGILSAARRDGLLPTRLLPAVHDLIGHTEAVLEELRRLSE